MSDIAAFHTLLRSLKHPRILAVCGAGLSAASGLPTFRGAGGLWRNYEATSLATPQAFKRDPGLVWTFYAYRRHKALGVEPNGGHWALAQLAERLGDDFLCLTQNVDNLHERAHHPTQTLKHLHGSLFDLKCTRCPWKSYDDRNPLPGIAHVMQRHGVENLGFLNVASVIFDVLRLEIAAQDSAAEKLLDPAHALDPISPKDLPRCPECGGLARPAVVWFGESLDSAMLEEADEWIEEKPVDIVLVVGTSAVVYPAAGYAELARTKNTHIVTVNLEIEGGRRNKNDFHFEGDASVLLPELLEPIIGKPSAS